MNKINNNGNNIFAIFTYLKAYEKSVEDLQNYKSYEIEKDGYLISLKDYEFIKKITCFNDLMGISEKYLFEQKINELESLNILAKIKCINPIKINSTEELIKLIKEKHEYILIDKYILDNILPIQNHQKKIYLFNAKYFILELIIGEKSIKFYNNKYILNEDSYNICNKNEALTKISKAMIEYYIFENMMKKKSKRNKRNKKKERVYLFNKNDIDEWKESTNYKNIKNNLLKDKYKFEYIEYEINNQLLMFYKNKKAHVKPIKPLNFISIKELEDYIKENSLVFVNKNFYDLIIKEEGKEEKEQNIFCIAINDLITIYIDKKGMEFHSNNNVLYSIKESYIRILLQIFFFQEELNINIKKPIDVNQNIKIGLIQKDWIRQFKSYLNYDNLKVLFNNSSKIKEYNYSSLSDNIIGYLINNVLKDYKDSIDKKNKIEQLNFGKDKQLILNEMKINKPKSKTLKYYNDFEIVSSDILTSLQILFNKFSSSFYEPKNCIIGNNRIIILILDEFGNDYYEIGNINNNIFHSEYLLDFNNKIEFKILSKILYRNDFEDFLSNIYNDNLNNFFPMSSQLECLSYKINIEHDERNINQINDNNNQIKENIIIDKIKNILLSIYLFEKKLNNKCEKSKDKISNKNNLYFYKDCYLINSKFLSEFKNLFLYDFPIQQINNQKKNELGIEKTIFDNFFSGKYNFYSTIIKENCNIIINNDLFRKLNRKEIKIDINKSIIIKYHNLNNIY